MKAEAAHYAKTRETIEQSTDRDDDSDSDSKGEIKQIEDETPEAKRRRILEETRDLDADSASEEDDGSSSSDRYRNSRVALPLQTVVSQETNDLCSITLSSDDDDEDETAELMRELEKIKKERAEAKEREVCYDLRHQSME